MPNKPNDCLGLTPHCCCTALKLMACSSKYTYTHTPACNCSEDAVKHQLCQSVSLWLPPPFYLSCGSTRTWSQCEGVSLNQDLIFRLMWERNDNVWPVCCLETANWTGTTGIKSPLTCSSSDLIICWKGPFGERASRRQFTLLATRVSMARLLSVSVTETNKTTTRTEL